MPSALLGLSCQTWQPLRQRVMQQAQAESNSKRMNEGTNEGTSVYFWVCFQSISLRPRCGHRQEERKIGVVHQLSKQNQNGIHLQHHHSQNSNWTSQNLGNREYSQSCNTDRFLRIFTRSLHSHQNNCLSSCRCWCWCAS